MWAGVLAAIVDFLLGWLKQSKEPSVNAEAEKAGAATAVVQANDSAIDALAQAQDARNKSEAASDAGLSVSDPGHLVPNPNGGGLPDDGFQRHD